MSHHQYKFNVQMGCSGCSNAIKEALEGQSGLKSLNISLEDQSVLVVADQSLSYTTVLKAIRQKGKTVRSVEVDGVAQSI
ncbi:hypothetical protein BJX96DRAFT_150289 [Aspergillus floccosus]